MWDPKFKKPSWNPQAVILLWLVWAAPIGVLLFSCTHNPAPYAPGKASTRTLNPATIAGSSGRPKLQIIITYSELYCTHSALRLEQSGRPVVFWDPGGTYGINAAVADQPLLRGDVKKTNDLIIHQAPTIPAYWDFSYEGSDHAMEVFEWDLSDQRAERIYEFLLASAGINENQSDFQTGTAGGFCSVAISEFLSRFPGEPFHVPLTYFFPHDLAEQLYTRHPDRVIVLRRDQPPTEYTSESSKESLKRESKGPPSILK